MLRLERKQSPDVSRALWIPTIWFLVITSKDLGVWLQIKGGDVESGSPYDRAFFILLMGLALVILIRRNFNWAQAIRENAALVAVITFMLLSIAWSDIPFISFKRWTRELVAVLMAFMVLSEASPRKALESILMRMAYIHIPLSIVLINYFPQLGARYYEAYGITWTGVATHKNGLGALCMIVALLLIWSMVRRWQGHYPQAWKHQTLTEAIYLLATLRLMMGPRGSLSYSATSNVAFAFGLIVFCGLVLFNKKRRFLGAGVLSAFVIFMMIFGIATFFWGGSTVSSYASSVGRDATLTGRTQIWAILLPGALQKPLGGSGFRGFWTTRTMAALGFSSAHSGYLELLISLGFVGIALMSIFYLSTCRKAIRELSRDYDWGVLFIVFLVIILIHNLAEASLDNFANFITSSILFFSVSSTTRSSSGSQAIERAALPS